MSVIPSTSEIRSEIAIFDLLAGLGEVGKVSSITGDERADDRGGGDAKVAREAGGEARLLRLLGAKGEE